MQILFSSHWYFLHWVYFFIQQSCQGNETFLSCVTPELTEELPSIECVRTQRLRRRTDNVLRTDYSEIYAVLGLQFDGLQDYQRLNTSFKTKIFPNPAIRRLTKAERSLTEDEILLEIFGYGLVDCCRADDYSVTVGNEECVIENLTNSRIICKLPESFHSAEHNSTFSLTVSSWHYHQLDCYIFFNISLTEKMCEFC